MAYKTICTPTLPATFWATPQMRDIVHRIAQRYLVRIAFDPVRAMVYVHGFDEARVDKARALVERLVADWKEDRTTEDVQQQPPAQTPAQPTVQPTAQPTVHPVAQPFDQTPAQSPARPPAQPTTQPTAHPPAQPTAPQQAHRMQPQSAPASKLRPGIQTQLANGRPSALAAAEKAERRARKKQHEIAQAATTTTTRTTTTPIPAESAAAAAAAAAPAHNVVTTTSTSPDVPPAATANVVTAPTSPTTTEIAAGAGASRSSSRTGSIDVTITTQGYSSHNNVPAEISSPRANPTATTTTVADTTARILHRVPTHLAAFHIPTPLHHLQPYLADHLFHSAAHICTRAGAHLERSDDVRTTTPRWVIEAPTSAILNTAADEVDSYVKTTWIPANTPLMTTPPTHVMPHTPATHFAGTLFAMYYYFLRQQQQRQQQYLQQQQQLQQQLDGTPQNSVSPTHPPQ